MREGNGVRCHPVEGGVCYNFARWLRKFGSIHSRNVGSKLVGDDIAHSCLYIDLARVKNEARVNIYSLLEENIKSFFKY